MDREWSMENNELEKGNEQVENCYDESSQVEGEVDKGGNIKGGESKRVVDKGAAEEPMEDRLPGLPDSVYKDLPLLLIPSAENGLFSRFIFYYMNIQPVWKLPGDGAEVGIDRIQDQHDLVGTKADGTWRVCKVYGVRGQGLPGCVEDDEGIGEACGKGVC